MAEIIVGSFGEKSGVAIDGEMVVEAESGADGDNEDGGGQGYSGGVGGAVGMEELMEALEKMEEWGVAVRGQALTWQP